MKHKNIKIGMKVKVKETDETSKHGCDFNFIKASCGQIHKVKEINREGGANHFKLENRLYYHHDQLEGVK